MIAKNRSTIDADPAANNVRFEQCVKRIRKDGYCLIQGLFDPKQIKSALDLVRLWDERMASSQSTVRPNLAGKDHYVLNLQNKDIFFLDFLLNVSIFMKIFKYFLNDPWYKQIREDKANFIFRSYVARTSNTSLPLHLDTFLPHPGKYPCVMQAIIALEDQTVANGCTVVVPGS
jgi:ectoine hydroxylase-related dioxygenase (phytanoyl-CoA dioxygenase family)